MENPDAQHESGLTADDGAILHGALDYKVRVGTDGDFRSYDDVVEDDVGALSSTLVV